MPARPMEALLHSRLPTYRTAKNGGQFLQVQPTHIPTHHGLLKLRQALTLVCWG